MKKRIIHIIVLSCKKAVQLIEKKLHTKLSRRERIQLKWHKGICDVCVLYEKQVVFIDKGLKDNPSEIPADQVFHPHEVEVLQTKIIHSIEG